jgi:hypothetical protein
MFSYGSFNELTIQGINASGGVHISVSRVEFHLSIPQRFAMGALKENSIGGAAVDGNVARSESTFALRATEPAHFTDQNDDSKHE